MASSTSSLLPGALLAAGMLGGCKDRTPDNGATTAPPPPAGTRTDNPDNMPRR